MPSWNLGELMSTATTRAGRRADIHASTVSALVNEAYFEVANASEFAMLEKIAVSSTTSGENRIDLPADYAEMMNLSMKWSWSTSESAVSSTKTLGRISLSEYDARGHLPVGEPQAYTHFNNWLELWPSPNSAYSLQMRYRSQVTDMTSLTDVPSVATIARKGILLKTIELIHEHMDNQAGAVVAESRYQSYMQGIKTDEYRRQMGEAPMGIWPVYGSSQRRRSNDE